jgi:hypothetical protein
MSNNRVLLNPNMSKVYTQVRNTKTAFSNSLLNLSNTDKSILIILVVVVFVITFVLVKKKLNDDSELKLSDEPVFITGKLPHHGKNNTVFSNKGNNYFNKKNSNQLTYSYWLYVDSKQWSLPEYKGKWKHIMHYGDMIEGKINPTNINQMPGCWMWPNTNRLWCVVNTGDGPDYGEGIIIDDVPLNRWFNVALVVNRQMFDVYIDGKLERTVTLYKEPLFTDDGALFVTTNDKYIKNTKYDPDDPKTSEVTEEIEENTGKIAGGFPGFIGYIAYFNRALTPKEIYKLMMKYKGKIDKWDSDQLLGLGVECKVSYQGESISGDIDF